jgi:hypothetical protein
MASDDVLAQHMTVGIPSPPSQAPLRARSRSLLIAGGLVLLVATGAGVAWWQTRDAESNASGTDSTSVAATVTDTSARAPAGLRIRVRVLNVSGVPGLARRATNHLREYGFDVVDFGSGRRDGETRTRISNHTSHADWPLRVQRALGVGVIATDPDTSRYVDLTVYLGRDWRPSTETLRP